MKKGFTLIELLAVIALLAVLVVFVVPNVLKLLKGSKDDLSDVQKKEIKEAVTLYINDYCINPISDSVNCEFSTTIDTNKKIVVTGEITLAQFLTRDYTKDYFKSGNLTDKCEGSILITNNVVNIDDIECNF